MLIQIFYFVFGSKNTVCMQNYRFDIQIESFLDHILVFAESRKHLEYSKVYACCAYWTLNHY